MPREDIAHIATGRTLDLFASDIAIRRQEIAEAVAGKRFLLIGGAGSIGAATLRVLLEFAPATIHIVDHNENNLAELVRDLRSGPQGLSVQDFRCLPLDFGSPVMLRFLRSQAPYDAVLNFAAIKHVRSEKDVFSMLQMLETNVLKNARLLRWLDGELAPLKFFSVSTDKAANPVNVMGVSKRLMEDVIFSWRPAREHQTTVTSARFANVAFSEGSLLQSFERRLDKRQPMAVPKNTKRYFLSLREAGQICLLALFCAPPGHLLVPRLSPENDLYDLEEIAVRFLLHHGLKPRIYEEEGTARASVEANAEAGYYPVLVTPLDTSGEKAFEEFVGNGEFTVEVGMPNLLGIRAQPASSLAIGDFLAQLTHVIENVDVSVDREWIVERISAIHPDFRPHASTKNLDDRI